ncbi:MAG: hypothetical protein KIT43_01130 [Bauldia sp.]|nr:hypothetical protein [Bauldia sp.]
MVRKVLMAFGPALLGVLILAPGNTFGLAATDYARAEGPEAAAIALGPGSTCIAEFDRRVQPILNLRCVQCHQSVTGGGGLSLQAAGTAERIVLVPSSGSALNLVEPGRPEQSYLYLKVTGRQAEVSGMGARMPLIGIRLSDESIETIRAWIEGCTVLPGFD